jgi:flagellar motor protein MotB
VTVAFPPGSAALSPLGVRDLGSLATHRAGRSIVVAGRGDAPEGDQVRQADSLTLAWQRAQALARALAAAGVPPGAIEVTAGATGEGGVARFAD